MEVLRFGSKRQKVRKVRNLIKSCGNKIGSVHFIKRTDGKKRKMSYRLHVKNPKYANSPNHRSNKKLTEDKNRYNLITVFDVNKVIYNKKGKMCGRGGYRNIPLDNVKRIKVDGVIYKIM